MELHARLINAKTVSGIAVGELEIWSDNCANDAEKALAMLLTTNMQNTMQILTSMSEALFEKPIDVEPNKDSE